jgi:hypothetical protein
MSEVNNQSVCSYFDAFTDQEKTIFDKVRDNDALDHEIKMLRVKIYTLIMNQPDNYAMLVRLMMCLNQVSRTNVKVFKRDAVDLQKIRESTIAMIRESGVSLEYVESRFRQDSVQAR